MIKKKGIEPKKENNTQTQDHNNKLWNTCLVLFVLFVILVIVGEAIDNPVVTALGFGLGTGAGAVSSTLLFGGIEE